MHRSHQLVSMRGGSTHPRPPPAMEIPELVELVLSKLARPVDLLSMACTAHRYADVALKLLWEHPDFKGDPLRNMASLFPNGIKDQLLKDIPVRPSAPDTHQGSQSQPQDLSLRVPSSLFTRFDYYAKFVRHLQVWQFRPDKYIANVLDASRPAVTLFPNLESIHLGADSNSLEMAGPYLSSTLRTVRVNHWDPETSTIVHSTAGITATLIKMFTLPDLQCLDLLDTRLPRYEHNQDVMDRLLHLIPRLVEFYSCDLTTFRPIFDALAQSNHLNAIFLDLAATYQDHYKFAEIVQFLRDAFLPLQSLVVHCAGEIARDFVEQASRALESFDFRIDGPLDVDELTKLTTSLKASEPTLRVLKCSTSLRAPSGAKDSLYQALTPLLQMSRLQKLVVSLTVLGSSMFRDDEVEGIFQCWPNLCVFTLECDPEEGTPIGVDDPKGFGLSLLSLFTIRRCCPDLYELSLPYLDTADIPLLEDVMFSVSALPFEIHLSRCHAHNRKEVREFICAIWSKAESSFEDCMCPELVDDR
ncbi:hypothetical protein CALVIDRAFT_188642 [Calocera viscosa TUFC12733]|uniref:Uncharacterized protein n=1 Tax=Calocera viscosa (strain TUFC12733) TaxID=1330018 RepID=A0A167KWE1_CALVF|nr:hypothetical protein CALVIDRAFT_188642 [Calocera viscosa TUFC12733]